MPPQDTSPSPLAKVIAEWRVFAHDNDPIVAAAARELLHDLRTDRPSRALTEDRPPAPWRDVIGQVIAGEPRSSVTTSGYKTGHGHAHDSRSGTCVSVNLERGIWYCSSPSCRRGGTAITWVMDTEDCGYGEAWEMLCRRFGAAHA